MPFQSEKQKKWMWANKPEMAREWTQEYGSKVKAKTGTMAKKDDKWIQKATKNMRKDKPCTGDKFGGPTCPKGSRRYNLAKTFKKMNKPKKAFLGKMFRKSSTATPTSGSSSGRGGLLRRLFEEKKHLFGKAGGGPIKAKDSKFINKPSKWDKSLKNIRKTYTLANELKVEDKLTAADLENARKIIKSGRMPPHHSRNKGGPIKAKHGQYIPIPTPHADIAKYVTKRGVVEGPQGKDTFWRKKDSTMKNKIPRDVGLKKRKAGPGMGIGKRKKPQIIILGTNSKLKILGDEAKGGQGFTPGWKPQLSVRTAKTGKIFDTKKVSSKTHARFMKLFKHREAGGWKEATGYKKHLKALKAMTTKSTALGKANRAVGALPYAKAKAKMKAKYGLGKASTSTFLQRRMALETARPTALGVAKALGKRTGIGKAVLAATAVAGAYEAGKRKLFTKDKKKVQKKSTGGEIIIGRGVDLDLL